MLYLSSFVHPSGYIQTHNNTGTALVLEIKLNEILLQALLKMTNKIKRNKVDKMMAKCTLQVHKVIRCVSVVLP